MQIADGACQPGHEGGACGTDGGVESRPSFRWCAAGYLLVAIDSDCAKQLRSRARRRRLVRAAMRFGDDGAGLQMQLQGMTRDGGDAGKQAASGGGRSRGDVAHGKLQFRLRLRDIG